MIAVAANDPELLARLAWRGPNEQGISVLTRTRTVGASGHSTFVNQAPIDAVGGLLVELMGEAAWRGQGGDRDRLGYVA